MSEQSCTERQERLIEAFTKEREEARSLILRLLKDKARAQLLVNELTVAFVAPVEDIGKHVSTINALHTPAEVTMLAVQVQNATVAKVLEILEDTL